ncbi:MAG: hypothetical protein ACHP84_05195 [Caulobacterales bacterium]
MTPNEEVFALGKALQADGLEGLADELLHAHRGIFIATELYMAWRFYVRKVLAEPELAAATRTQAEALCRWLDEALK